MSENYYKPCKEFDECNELIEKYFLTKQYGKCFEGHMKFRSFGEVPSIRG